MEQGRQGKKDSKGLIWIAAIGLSLAVGWEGPRAAGSLRETVAEWKRAWVLDYIWGELGDRKLEVDLKKGLKLEIKEMDKEKTGMALYACTVRQDQLTATIRGIAEMAQGDDYGR